jgi:uncharacterized protein YfaS (alpha-2-macroglobulin family)
MKSAKKYDTRWQKIDDLFAQGLPASATPEIVSLMSMAKSEQNTEQYIKGICYYRASLRDRDEESGKHDLEYLEQELNGAAFPAKQLLHSMLGDLYWNYYQDNRWKILDRTKVQSSSAKKDSLLVADVETWSADDFYQQAYHHFSQSLQQPDLLQKLPITDFAELIEKGMNTEKLRPTLYDFLMHRAIDYFTRDETELTKPEYAFEIDDERAYAPLRDFIRLKPNTSDTFSAKYQVLKRYQQVLSFHVSDTDPSALIDADLGRILYVHSKSIAAEKNALYRNALEHLISAYPDNEQVSMAMFYVAETYTQGGVNWGAQGRFNNAANEQEIDYVEAHKRCTQLISKYPKAEGAVRAKALLQQIESHFLGFQHEKVILPNTPSLSVIQFKNVQTVYAKIIPLSLEEYKIYQSGYAEHRDKLIKRSGMKNWTVPLPVRTDFKQHTTEIKIDGVPAGFYAIVMSESPSFDKKSFTHLSFINASALAYVLVGNTQGKGSGLYVVHRDSGIPMNQVKVNTWINYYDYNKRKFVSKAGPVYTTNDKGFVQLKGEPSQQGYSIELIKGNDKLYLNDVVHLNEFTTYDQAYIRTYVFTDRSIYRPGQTIYVKGIMVHSQGKENKQHQLATNRKTMLQLLDANRQLVKELTLTTNEFGSFHTTFTAPEGLLTGQYYLQNEGGTSSFSVEEYKRPTFEVVFDTLNTQYKLYDTIHVKGKVTAFSGVALDAAVMRYRIVREARFPYDWYAYRWGRPASPSMEIAHGTVRSQPNGGFDIPFKAIPDATVDRRSAPVFTYRILTEVTDVNGETRSGSTSIPVAYQSMLVQIDSKDQLDQRELSEIKIQTTNVSGRFVPASVRLRIVRLQAPAKVYRQRMWPKPEIISIPEPDFRRDFPFDEYYEENNYRTWKEEKQLYATTFQSNENGTWQLPERLPVEGWYLVEAIVQNEQGEELIEKKYIRIMQAQKPKALPNEHLHVVQQNAIAQPGDISSISYSVPYPQAYILYHAEHHQESAQWIPMQGFKQIEYRIDETDRGGFYVHAFYVKHNRVYQQTTFIQVPWSNKELTIKLETFRDKMLPGSAQQWKLHVSGLMKEKVSAEVLATMYDASLDAFKPHAFEPMRLFQSNSQQFNWNSMLNFSVQYGQLISSRKEKGIEGFVKVYPYLNWFGLQTIYYAIAETVSSMDRFEDEGGRTRSTKMPMMKTLQSMPVSGAAQHMDDQNLSAQNAATNPPLEASEMETVAVNRSALRTNFNETAFFMPDLQTDSEGNVVFQFTVPDALTRWKLQAFAHTTALQSGLLTALSATQKELMIVPNTPRFLREGDRMFYSAKVTNQSQENVSGEAILELENARTGESVAALFQLAKAKQRFELAQGQSNSIQWQIKIPDGFTDPLLVRTLAQTEGHQDGEQHIIPVLLNSILVTETLPLPVKTNSSRNFVFKKLLESGKSNSLRHHQVSVEYTGNPAWYAVQALPYLTDFPFDCAEQTFNRFYANTLAAYIANASPETKEIVQRWNTKDTSALLSNLQKNQELKSALLQETPWVLQAQDESQQRQKIAYLFDPARMSKESAQAIKDLQQMQTPNGGFSWFRSMPDDQFITQYIMTGIGKLLHIGIPLVNTDKRIAKIVEQAIPYLDERMNDMYTQLLKQHVDVANYHPSYLVVQYLYMRSFFLNIDQRSGTNEAFLFFKNKAATHWLKQTKFMQAMLSVALNRYGDTDAANAIIRSLRENAIRDNELGMYWKENRSGYYWHEAPIEAQSVMIEAFSEVAQREDEVDELKIWLLKQKQTNHWRTSKATADACYALLLNGTYWLSYAPDVDITMGTQLVSSKTEATEAGTSYFKRSFTPEQIRSDMGNIRVSVKAADEKGKSVQSTTWGAVYWQYFEQLDKITAAETPLKLSKHLFIEQNTASGPVLKPLQENQVVQIGDKIKVRIELRVDLDMEYLHLKDMRAACFEPLNVLTGYKFQGGLGYLESTKDLATHFFFSHVQKGTYVFEYPMFATLAGDFSNGIATIQCMYAPEFSSHSDGIRVTIK